MLIVTKLLKSYKYHTKIIQISSLYNKNKRVFDHFSFRIDNGNKTYNHPIYVELRMER